MRGSGWKKSAAAFLAAVLLVPVIPGEQAEAAAPVVINEIAWMGTTESYTNEWMELYNPGSEAVSLDGWTLEAQDGTPAVELEGSIEAGGYYLLERTDDSSVPDAQADLIYTGNLGNTGEYIELRRDDGGLEDEVDDWHAGDNATKAAMARVDASAPGTDSENWTDAETDYSAGLGTPGGENTAASSEDAAQVNCTNTTETLNQVSEDLGAINVYFNKCADTSFSSEGNEANYNVNLEDRLIKRLNEAETSIDLQTYEINLPGIIDTLTERAADGIDVRVIADAKDADDPHYEERYETMRLLLEQLVRGADGEIGTTDDVEVFSESPMFAVEDSTKRAEYDLPAVTDIDEVTVGVGNGEETGRLFVEGEEKGEDSYYSVGTQMHNKFAVIDEEWVFTGSWNFTVTGLYGTEENMENGVLGGNQQHVVEINWPELAGIYTTEFNEMWGSEGMQPDPAVSNFNTRKEDNTVHQIDVDGVPVQSYFSPSDNAVGTMTEYVKEEADYSALFTIFAWSDQALVDELKYKWENSYEDNVGERTGFDVKGVYDSSFWNQWWSASIEMRGEEAAQESENNPNIRWANEAPVYKDNESRKLHSKTMVIDADTDSDPTVIMGATNWSNNGNNVNDENMLFIHDEAITNQFVQEMNARYLDAGGSIQ
ncbi:phospholipase D-like domain-containing protein [Alkalicoccus urumqiensis]|uniref:phospholipase D n=1 Tax=Alkalicoccus urumqiensis TaxID=1548213 RepID=A0A2P6MLY7_ALKUR|nr:phospholipase D-like domain-containing protein [Alkalicoccus urumqiensis]PRO67314.1 competence protein ComEA [Alkalicoccus urumqiensis]